MKTKSRWPYPFVRARVQSALAASRTFRNWSVWAAAVVCFDGDDATCRVVSRVELAEEFRSNDMPEQAREVLARRVGHGHVLLWLAGEEGCNWVVLDLLGKQVARC